MCVVIATLCALPLQIGRRNIRRMGERNGVGVRDQSEIGGEYQYKLHCWCLVNNGVIRDVLNLKT